jgi:hypothetical protein
MKDLKTVSVEVQIEILNNLIEIKDHYQSIEDQEMTDLLYDLCYYKKALIIKSIKDQINLFDINN